MQAVLCLRVYVRTFSIVYMQRGGEGLCLLDEVDIFIFWMRIYFDGS